MILGSDSSTSLTSVRQRKVIDKNNLQTPLRHSEDSHCSSVNMDINSPEASSTSSETTATSTILPPFQINNDDQYSTAEDSDCDFCIAEEPEICVQENDYSGLLQGTLKSKLTIWSLRNIKCLTQKCIDELLMLLESEGYHLPKSSKTLFGTSNLKTESKLMLGSGGKFGQYKYFGIRSNLKIVIDPKIFREKSIRLLINVDGMELFKNSKNSLWPILGKVYSPNFTSKPFIIAAFSGHSKPNSAQEFMSDFVEEVNTSINEGVTIKDTHYDFSIAGFTCDIPARAFIKCCKGHTGFYCCERCEIKGITVNKRRAFLSTDSKKRTFESFKNQTQAEHHSKKEISPLISIQNFDPVRAVFLDKMHGLDLGVCKYFVHKFVNGTRKYGIGLKNVEILQKLMNDISEDIPIEFQRKKFDLSNLTNWKATQFRFFLLYASGIFLYHVLNQERYQHFMLLFVACRILCSRENAVSEAKTAAKFLESFVKLMPTYYGSDSVGINFHNLIHLADDVIYMNAPLSDFSAYDFENCLGFIGNLVTVKKNPIGQLNRKLNSLQNAASHTCISSRFPLTFVVAEKSETAIMSERSNDKIIFTSIKIQGYDFRTSHPDNVILTNNGQIMEIKKIYSPNPKNVTMKNLIFEGFLFKTVSDLFHFPVPSNKIGIYNVCQKQYRLVQISGNNVKTKCILTQVQNKTVAISLLHT